MTKSRAAQTAAKPPAKIAAAAKAAKTSAGKITEKTKTAASKPIASKAAAEARKPLASEKKTAPVVATKPEAAKAAAKPVAAVKAPAAPTKPVVAAKPVAAPAAPIPVLKEKPVESGRATPPVPAKPASLERPNAPVVKAKPTASQKLGFKLHEFIVYPAHGVGQIIGVEIQEVAGFSLELFVVSFIKDKMILKVPTSKVVTVGMRKLAEGGVVDRALTTLSGRARIKRTMWSRRAQEYEAKINSGDLITIAEVVRDLYRSDTQPEQSYSERQLYEAALDRMAREIAAVRKLIDSEALKLIESFLLKGPRRGQKSDAEGGEDADEADVDRAA